MVFKQLPSGQGAAWKYVSGGKFRNFLLLFKQLCPFVTFEPQTDAASDTTNEKNLYLLLLYLVPNAS